MFQKQSPEKWRIFPRNDRKTKDIGEKVLKKENVVDRTKDDN